jgi:hypothetical protein
MMLARYRKRHVAELERARREAARLIEAALEKHRAAVATASPDLFAAEEVFAAAVEVEHDALWRAVETVPTTPAGIHALARFGAVFLGEHGCDYGDRMAELLRSIVAATPAPAMPIAFAVEGKVTTAVAEPLAA